MGAWKSQAELEFWFGLLSNVLRDAYVSYPEISSHELERDISTLRARMVAEGFGFISKTLPKLGKALLNGLETGQLIVPSEFPRKRMAGVRWNIPTFMSALFLTTFDHQGTLVLSQGTAVGFLRQVCLMAYKVEMPPSPTQVKDACAKFKQIESELPSQSEIVRRVPADIIRKAKYLLRQVFHGFDPTDVRPRHGPGAVADQGVRGRSKYALRFYHPALDRLYPYSNYVTFAVHTQNLDELMAPYTCPQEIPPAKVVLVPKDSRGPRIISCEPALLQFFQQGLARKIYRLVETHHLTRDHVRFTDQSANRRRALYSSKNGNYATIDLADASDRVSLGLVRLLFPEEIVPYFLATRSRVAKLPNGDVLPLEKFAPMGSALCFPIEALTFWAIATAATWDVRRRFGGSLPHVLVFGDDIIVKNKEFGRVVEMLELFGLKVNRDKCFSRGLFRESCGCDAFNGEDVTPVKLHVPRSEVLHRTRSSVYRLSRNATALFDRGYWNTAEFLWRWCEMVVGELPTTGPAFAGVSRTSTLLPSRIHIPSRNRTRWHKDLCRVELRTFGLSALRTVSPFPTDALRLGHNLIQGMPEPYDDEVAAPHSAKPKAGWAVVV